MITARTPFSPHSAIACGTCELAMMMCARSTGPGIAARLG
jgi:hypothetical protein